MCGYYAAQFCMSRYECRAVSPLTNTPMLSYTSWEQLMTYKEKHGFWLKRQ